MVMLLWEDVARQASFSSSDPLQFISQVPPSAHADGRCCPYLSRSTRTCALLGTLAADFCSKLVVKASLPPVTEKGVHLSPFPVELRIDLSNF